MNNPPAHPDQPEPGDNLVATNVTGLILAGGRGQRLGGRDKGLVTYRGQPLVAHVASRIAPQVGPLLVSCNRNHEAYAQLGFKTVQDTLPGYPGPLAGIAASVDRIATPWMFCCPCDMPHVPTDVVACLQETRAHPVAYIHDGARAQPLVCLIHHEALTSVSRYLQTGGRSVLGWMKQQGATAVTWNSETRQIGTTVPFTNLNNPSDFAS